LCATSGCTRSNRLTDQQRLKVRICKARLVDVPIVTDATPLPDCLKDDLFGYSTGQEMDELVLFYKNGMSQFGWEMTGQFGSGVERALTFSKPHKVALILFRAANSENLVSVFISDC